MPGSPLKEKIVYMFRAGTQYKQTKTDTLTNNTNDDDLVQRNFVFSQSNSRAVCKKSK